MHHIFDWIGGRIMFTLVKTISQVVLSVQASITTGTYNKVACELKEVRIIKCISLHNI